MQQSPRGWPLLTVSSLSVSFGGVVALDNVSFAFGKSDICGLIGPNGAGKTTLFNCISGLVAPIAGAILLEGLRVDRLPRRSVVANGIARTFQNLGFYSEMTVLENVLLGAHHYTTQYNLPRLFNPKSGLVEERQLVNSCELLLANLDLKDVASKKAGSLPHPVLRRLEIARALLAKPRLLLLDEPAAGLTHGDVRALGNLLRSVRDTFGVSILLVEHHIELVMQLCDKIVVLQSGRKIAEGSPHDIRSNPVVLKAYLGGVE